MEQSAFSRDKGTGILGCDSHFADALCTLACMCLQFSQNSFLTLSSILNLHGDKLLWVYPAWDEKLFFRPERQSFPGEQLLWKREEICVFRWWLIAFLPEGHHVEIMLSFHNEKWLLREWLACVHTGFVESWRFQYTLRQWLFPGCLNWRMGWTTGDKEIHLWTASALLHLSNQIMNSYHRKTLPSLAFRESCAIICQPLLREKKRRAYFRVRFRPSGRERRAPKEHYTCHLFSKCFCIVSVETRTGGILGELYERGRRHFLGVNNFSGKCWFTLCRAINCAVSILELRQCAAGKLSLVFLFPSQISPSLSCEYYSVTPFSDAQLLMDGECSNEKWTSMMAIMSLCHYSAIMSHYETFLTGEWASNW